MSGEPTLSKKKDIDLESEKSPHILTKIYRTKRAKGCEGGRDRMEKTLISKSGKGKCMKGLQCRKVESRD